MNRLSYALILVSFATLFGMTSFAHVQSSENDFVLAFMRKSSLLERLNKTMTLGKPDIVLHDLYFKLKQASENFSGDDIERFRDSATPEEADAFDKLLAHESISGMMPAVRVLTRNFPATSEYISLYLENQFDFFEMIKDHYEVESVDDFNHIKTVKTREILGTVVETANSSTCKCPGIRFTTKVEKKIKEYLELIDQNRQIIEKIDQLEANNFEYEKKICKIKHGKVSCKIVLKKMKKLSDIMPYINSLGSK